MTITVIGASGFLGKNIVNNFHQIGTNVIEFNRGDSINPALNYGTVFYCAGVSIDFNKKAFEAVNAHVNLLSEWLTKANFDKLVYISSTRLYNESSDTTESNSRFNISREDIYNQTKLLAEALCLHSEKDTIVLRLSNVTSHNILSPYFIWNVFQQLKNQNVVEIHETPNSTRDYLPLPDFLNIVNLLIHSNLAGTYNISSGINISHKELISMLPAVQINQRVNYGTKENINEPIPNTKISRELNYKFQNPAHYIQSIWEEFNKGKSDDKPKR